MNDRQKHGFMVLLLIVSFCIAMTGCNNPVDQKKVDQLMTDKPVSVRWNPGESNEIESFQADVEVYMMNNRKDTGATLQDKYRIATKLIDGTRYTRVDMDPQMYQGQTRMSVISNEKEIILFDPDTEVVSMRLPIDDVEVSADLSFLGLETGFSRLDITDIRQQANRLSMKIEDDDTSGLMILELPTELVGNFSDKRISTRIAFDTTEETLQLVETVDYVEEDGSTITTTMQPMYQEVDGTPVKIGMITVIDTQIPNLIEGDWSEIPIYNSLNDIPTISDQEFEELQAAGKIHEAPPSTFGNPADLSSIDIMMELYSDVQVNETPDSTFRLLLEGGDK